MLLKLPLRRMGVARRQVDAGAIHVGVVAHVVAHVAGRTQGDAAVVGQGGVHRRQQAVHRKGGAHRIARLRKGGDQAVAHALEQSATMLG